MAGRHGLRGQRLQALRAHLAQHRGHLGLGRADVAARELAMVLERVQFGQGVHDWLSTKAA
jgi:hypothetical protein